jgi:hypothetical protein
MSPLEIPTFAVFVPISEIKAISNVVNGLSPFHSFHIAYRDCGRCGIGFFGGFLVDAPAWLEQVANLQCGLQRVLNRAPGEVWEPVFNLLRPERLAIEGPYDFLIGRLSLRGFVKYRESARLEVELRFTGSNLTPLPFPRVNRT